MDDMEWLREIRTACDLPIDEAPHIGPPALTRLVDALTHSLAETDDAYQERNRVVAALAELSIRLGYRAGVTRTDIPDWDEAWHNCVYIDLPTGQVSWHFHDSDRQLFESLPDYPGIYDGHTSDEKYLRLERLCSESR